MNTKPRVLVLNHTRPCQAYTHTPDVKRYDNQVAASCRHHHQELHVRKHFEHRANEDSNYETQPNRLPNK
jgi:hypothetical protein